jgi:cyclic pyranopterin phosphate synthase
MIHVYTDGACLGNPGPGGWGAVIIENGLSRELSGKEADTTNNRMEITAVIEALKEVPQESEIVVYSDSTYVINTMVKNWKRNKNTDLWDLLDRQMSGRKVKWEWVKGHSGDPLNERADRLAHGAATSIANPKKKDINEDMGLSEDLKRKKVGLTHIDSAGAAKMVDVGSKPDTEREATAKGFVRMKRETIKLIQDNNFEKGDVLAVARIAGVMGAKETSRLIPLCHPIPLTQVTIEFDIDDKEGLISITSTAKCIGKTGVEMEALNGSMIAALTIYDMCKSVDRGMQIGTQLSSKTGGQSGNVFLDR